MHLNAVMIDDFGRFWNIYPRRVSVVNTRQAWIEAIVHEDPEVIIQAAQKFADDPNRDEIYTPTSIRWLTEKRWMDSPLPPRKLTPEEAQSMAQAQARVKRARERQESQEAFRADEEARKNAVPMPSHLKQQLLKQWGLGVFSLPKDNDGQQTQD